MTDKQVYVSITRDTVYRNSRGNLVQETLVLDKVPLTASDVAILEMVKRRRDAQ